MVAANGLGCSVLVRIEAQREQRELLPKRFPDLYYQCCPLGLPILLELLLTSLVGNESMSVRLKMEALTMFSSDRLRLRHISDSEIPAQNHLFQPN